VLAAGIAAGCASRSGVDPESELPIGPTELGVLYGVDVVDRWTALEDEALGDVGFLELGPERLRIVGTRAARLGTGAVPFQDPADWTAAADLEPVDGAGAVAYVSRGGNASPVGTYDAAGAILWRSPDAANRLAAGDLDGDGALDLVVGATGRRGLERLDAAGARVWSAREKEVRGLELLDLDGDGTLEILHGHAAGDLVVRSASGAVRERLETAEPLGRFTLDRDGAAPALVYAGASSIHRLALVTGTDLSFPTIHPVRAADVRGTTVRLAPDTAPVHAFLADFRTAERSFLALYGADGALLHETVLSAPCGALSVERSDPEGDVVAVGCRGRVELFGRAIPLQRRALAARQALLGPDDPSLAAEHRALAAAYAEAGRTAEAEPHAWRAVELVEKAHGKDAPETAAAQAVLASVIAARGDREAAELRLLRALALATPPDAPDHAALWSVHAALGAFYAASGETARAEAHDREALALLPDEGRATSRVRADIAYRLASLLHAAGRHADASAAIAIAIDHHAYALGSEHAAVQSDRELEARIRAAAEAAPSPASPAAE
jgi:tetratricopeptide (TPR) repeat protein